MNGTETTNANQSEAANVAAAISTPAMTNSATSASGGPTKPISDDAASACMDIIWKEIEKSRRAYDELGCARATIIVNFGPESKRPILTKSQINELSLDKLILATFRALTIDECYPNGRKCTRCGQLMYHGRLQGYKCPICD